MPKIVDHERFREELLEKYFNLFAKRGYLNPTMREVAEELGVSTGTLYHYFPTKASLLEQLFNLASRRDSSAVLSQFDDHTPLDTRLKTFFDYVRDNEIYFRDIVLLTVDFYRFQDPAGFFEVMTEADRYYGETFEKGLKLEPDLAHMAMVFLNGLVYHRLVFPDSVSFESLADRFQEIFLHYLKGRRGSGCTE